MNGRAVKATDCKSVGNYHGKFDSYFMQAGKLFQTRRKQYKRIACFANQEIS